MKLPRPLNRNEVRQIDRIAIEQYGMSGLVLMENAGRGAADYIQQFADQRNVWILCGKGNNAGDGYVIARHLQSMGGRPTILQLVDPESLAGDAAANWQIARLAELPRRILSSPDSIGKTCEELAAMGDGDVIVDAMVGTGARGALREPFASIVDAVNRSTALKIAIDLPSGLDPDSGDIAGKAFMADHTLTFVAAKAGFSATNADCWTGIVTILPIGVPDRLLHEFAAAMT